MPATENRSSHTDTIFSAYCKSFLPGDPIDKTVGYGASYSGLSQS